MAGVITRVLLYRFRNEFINFTSHINLAHISMSLRGGTPIFTPNLKSSHMLIKDLSFCELGWFFREMLFGLEGRNFLLTCSAGSVMFEYTLKIRCIDNWPEITKFSLISIISFVRALILLAAMTVCGAPSLYKSLPTASCVSRKLSVLCGQPRKI